MKSEAVTAPNIGIGKDKQRLTAAWGKQISAYFELHKRYPKVQKHRNAKVKVSLVLNRLGHVVSVGVLQSSGDALYDEAAISMIRRSDPVPRPPAKLTDDEFNYSLDVNFEGRLSPRPRGSRRRASAAPHHEVNPEEQREATRLEGWRSH